MPTVMHRVLLGGMLALLPGQLLAKDDIRKEIELLKSRIAELEQKLEQRDAAPAATAPSPSSDAVKVTLSPGPKITSADGDTSISFDGRFATDAGFVMHDDGDLADATDIRTLRVGVKGTLTADWLYRMQVDFANDGASIKDAYLAYNGLNNVGLKAGHFKEFNGIEGMSSSLHTVFMERSVGSTTLHPSRNIGFGVLPHGKNWGTQLGVFGEGPGDNGSDDEGHSYTARAHIAPLLSDKQVLHVGVNARHRTPDAATDAVRFRARGDAHVIGERLVDTGTISMVEHHTLYAGEAFYRYGPFSAMAEYMVNDVSREGMPDVSFESGYATLSYFITGEQRPYKAKNGTYGRITPTSPFDGKQGGSGAWEVAGRYSFVDLMDGPVRGGKLDAWTAGINWFPTGHTKLMLNYVINDTGSDAVVPNNDPHLLMIRAQVDF